MRRAKPPVTNSNTNTDERTHLLAQQSVQDPQDKITPAQEFQGYQSSGYQQLPNSGESQFARRHKPSAAVAALAATTSTVSPTILQTQIYAKPVVTSTQSEAASAPPVDNDDVYLAEPAYGMCVPVDIPNAPTNQVSQTILQEYQDRLLRKEKNASDSEEDQYHDDEAHHLTVEKHKTTHDHLKHYKHHDEEVPQSFTQKSIQIPLEKLVKMPNTETLSHVLRKPNDLSTSNIPGYSTISKLVAEKKTKECPNIYQARRRVIREKIIAAKTAKTHSSEFGNPIYWHLTGSNLKARQPSQHGVSRNK